MLHLMDGLYLQSPLRTLSVLVFHLLLTHFCRGESQLIGPPQPIVARVGDDIILPCHLEPAMDVDTMTLEWTRSDQHKDVHVRRLGQDLEQQKSPSYEGRTSLFIEELKHGNISLKLSRVKLSDKGIYSCYIPGLEKRPVVELVVALDAASSPVISIADFDSDRGGVVLQCESKGWYPEPEVFWLDSEGNLLSAGPTETVRGPDDFYTVSSRVTVEKRHRNNVTCRVQQNDINQIRETHIIVNPDGFFKVLLSSFTVTTGLAVSLAVCIVLIVAVFFFGWKWRQNMIKTKRKHGDEPDGGGRNDTEMQRLNDGTDRDTGDEGAATRSFISPSQLERDESAPARSSISVCNWQIIKKQTLQDEQKKVQTLMQELKMKNQEIQTLQSNNQEFERRLTELKAQHEKELKEKQDELQQEKQKLESEVKNLKDQLSIKEKQIQRLMNSHQESERKLKAQHEKEDSS